MRTCQAEIVELSYSGSAWIACPAAGIPAAGQYLQAVRLDQPGQILPVSLLRGGLDEAKEVPAAQRQPGWGLWQAAPPLPPDWGLGARLRLSGPLGAGFHLADSARRLALVDMQGNPQRLLPLVSSALRRGTEVALFSDADLGLISPALPLVLEIYPLDALPENLNWPDLLAVDLTLEQLGELRKRLGLSFDQRSPCPVEVLLSTPMPCSGVADCGACAVPARRGYRLACKHGPVFDLGQLKW